MAFTCLEPKEVDKFKKALKSRDIQIADLLKMSSEARTALFKDFAGDQAKALNLLFEEKLVLKNKVLGLKNFIAKVAQEGKYSPAKKAELEKTASEFRAAQQERIFSPKEEQAFLNDLADKVVGTHVSLAESKNLYDLTVKVDELKSQGLNEEKGTWSSPKAKQAYGQAYSILQKYTEALKAGDTSLKTLLKYTYQTFKEDFRDNKPKAIADILKKAAGTVTDNSIALVASVDNSFIGRQGLHTLMTHPTVWGKMAKGSFKDFGTSLLGKDAHEALMADVYSDIEYINGEYQKAGILVEHEEQFQTSLPERMADAKGVLKPLVIPGRVFKASQAAFEGSAIRGRTGLYKLLKRTAERNEVKWDDTQIKDVGTMINSLTARGQWGKRGEPSAIRLVLWAPKMLKANWDVLTGHTLGTGLETAFARKEAAWNLGKIMLTSAGIMTIANALIPGSAETDLRSSDFGKVRIGNTRFDFTGGAGSLVTLAARAVTQSSKSTAGVVTKLNSGEYGSQTVQDVLINFLDGKTPPITGALIALYGKGVDYKGEKATYGSELARIAEPITIQNAIQLKDDSSTSAVLGVLLDAVGINANTYTKKKTDWTQNPGVELAAFQKKVGDENFQKANAEYNDKVATFMTSLETNQKYQALSSDDKQRVIAKKKDEIKSQVLTSYQFKYKRPKTTPVPAI